MSNPISDLVAGFQDLVAQVPDLVQPLIIAAAGAVPFIEGEGAAAIGVIGGLHPVVAALSGIAGNLLCVILVVLLSSRIREAAVTRKAARSAAATVPVYADGMEPVAARGGTATAIADVDIDKSQSKGRQKLGRWLVRFGVPGASILAPLALPTQFTAATLVAAGISKGRVIFWQAVAIVFWASLVTVSASIALRVVGS